MTDADTDGPLEAQSVGERLRNAREAKGLSLDAVADQTRIPIRHLQNIEREEWDALPAVTYAVGFTRSYANAVGLDGAELGREVRDQLGGTRTRTPPPEYYEQADPARVPPRALAIAAAAIALLLIVGYLIWRSTLDSDTAEENGTAAPVQEQAPPAQPGPGAQPLQPQAAAGQPVTLTATGEVWLRVSERGGGVIVERIMSAGDTYQVPPTARDPVLRVGAPESLRVAVGQTQIPQLGPSGQPVGDVSLRPEALVALTSPAQGRTPAR